MMQPIPGGAIARPFKTHPQRARHGPLPAHRPRALPEAARGGRLRARVRDQPQLPQRGHLDAAQPRVHDARVLPGVRATTRISWSSPRRCSSSWPTTLRGRHDARLGRAHARPHAAVAAAAVLRGAVAGSRARRDAGDRGRRPRRRGARRAGIDPRRAAGLEALEGRVRDPGRADTRPADLRRRLSRRAVAARQAQARESAAGRPLRAVRRPPRDGERLQRAERPGGPARALPRAGGAPGPRRRGGPLARRGLRAGARVRHAARRGRGDRHRPPAHAVREPALDPRGDSVPASETGGGRAAGDEGQEDASEARAAVRAAPRLAVPPIARASATNISRCSSGSVWGRLPRRWRPSSWCWP